MFAVNTKYDETYLIASFNISIVLLLVKEKEQL